MRLKIFFFFVLLSCSAASQANMMNINGLPSVRLSSNIKCILCKNGAKDVLNAIKNNHTLIADKIAKAECPKISIAIKEADCKNLIDSTIQLMTDNVTIDPITICTSVKFC